MISADKLRQFSLLSTLDATVLEELAAISEERTVPAGQWLFREGDPADALYFVVSGRVELTMMLDEKKDTYITLNVLSNGAPLGWSAIVAPYVYKLGALAATSATLVRLDGNRLRVLLEKYPEQGYVLMQGITRAMASRFDTIGEQIPVLSRRAVVTRALADAVSIGAGILIVAFGFFTVYAMVSGYSQSVPVFLFCLLVPVAVIFLINRLERTRTVKG
jgi:CRP-like cAMP-binding protein